MLIAVFFRAGSRIPNALRTESTLKGLEATNGRKASSSCYRCHRCERIGGYSRVRSKSRCRRALVRNARKAEDPERLPGVDGRVQRWRQEMADKKVALVTGVWSGIGRSLAVRLTEAGN